MNRVLLLGYGKPGRLDGGLGRALVRAFDGVPEVAGEHDDRPDIRHAALVSEFETVVVADAATSADWACFFRRLLPRRAERFPPRAPRPEAVLAMARDGFGWKGRAYLLGIRGYEFDGYGERLSPGARANLAVAVDLLTAALCAAAFDTQTTAGPLDDSAAACNGGAPCETAST